MAPKVEVGGTQTRLRDIAAKKPAEAGRKDGMQGAGVPCPDLKRQASGTNRKRASTAGSLPGGSGVLGPQEARLIRNLPL